MFSLKIKPKEHDIILDNEICLEYINDWYLTWQKSKLSKNYLLTFNSPMIHQIQ